MTLACGERWPVPGNTTIPAPPAVFRELHFFFLSICRGVEGMFSSGNTAGGRGTVVLNSGFQF